MGRKYDEYDYNSAMQEVMEANMYAMAVGKCINCDRVFGFNPNKVPSIRINGTKEPICRDCIKDLNAVRVAHGVPEWTISPDAYDPVDENEL